MKLPLNPDQKYPETSLWTFRGKKVKEAEVPAQEQHSSTQEEGVDLSQEEGEDPQIGAKSGTENIESGTRTRPQALGTNKISNIGKKTPGGRIATGRIKKTEGMIVTDPRENPRENPTGDLSMNTRATTLRSMKRGRELEAQL